MFIAPFTGDNCPFFYARICLSGTQFWFRRDYFYSRGICPNDDDDETLLKIMTYILIKISSDNRIERRLGKK